MNTKNLLFLIRHAETAWTLSGQHTGTTDLPLTRNGKIQSEGLAKVFMPQQFDKIFVSPLKRARETCHLAGFGKEAIVDPDLVEWDYGDFEGKTSLEILRTHPNWNLFHDGAPNGESVSQISHRADHFLKRLESFHGKIAVFSSGHILSVLIARWLGYPASHGQQFLLQPASLMLLGFGHQQRVLIAPSIDLLHNPNSLPVPLPLPET